MTNAAMRGLKDMAASASAGSAADLGMPERGKAAAAAWDGVIAAIAWVAGLRPGRQIVLVLSPAEARALKEAAGRGLAAADGQTASQQRNGYRAARALGAALQTIGHPLLRSRPERFEQPAEAIEPAAAAEHDEPRWHCRCGRQDIPAWRSNCDDCGRHRSKGAALGA